MIWNLKFTALVAVVALSACAVSAWYAYNKGRQSGMSEIRTQWDAEKLAIAEAVAKELERVRTVESNLRVALSKQRKEYQYENDRLSVLYQSALSSLSDRADRPSESGGGVPEGSNIGIIPANGCTGAELFRPDAEFLVGQAARADQLRIALKACLAHTTEIERQLNHAKETTKNP